MVSWTEKKTDTVIHNTPNHRSRVMSKVKRRRAEFPRHVTKKLEHLVTTGKIEGEGSRGRQQNKIQNYSAEWTDPTKREKYLQNDEKRILT